MTTSTLPNLTDLVADDTASSVIDPVDNNFLSTNNLDGQNIVSTLVYYTYNYTTQTYSDLDDVFDYSFDEKITVVGGTAANTYEVDVLIGGSDEQLFTGSVDGANLTPKAMALECGKLDVCQVIDLSAGPMTYARYLQLGASIIKKGAYLLTMKGKSFVQNLAQMDTHKSIAMVDIASGTAVLKNDVPINARYVEIAGGAMRIDETLNYSGDMTLAEGSVTIGANEVASYTGVFNDLGIVRGKGELEILGGGDFNTGVGAAVDVKTWLSKGNKTHETRDYIEGKLVFTGNFIVGADTTFTLHKGASLTVNEIANISGEGSTFDMADWDKNFNGDETIDVLGKVSKNESFYIGSTDTLELGAPTQFKGIIEGIGAGVNAGGSATALPSGGIALVGDWDYVSDVVNKAKTDTILTMKDIANNQLAHIEFAGIHSASEYSTLYELSGVTPTTVITVPQTVPSS